MFKDKNGGTPGTTDTLIGAGTEVEGLLKTEAGVRIEGTFIGEIECNGDVVIGEKGVGRCNISARDVIIAGRVFGDIHTRGKLTILSTGHVHGKLYTSVLSVQEGGVLNGSSEMNKADGRDTVAAKGDIAMTADELDLNTRQAG